MTSNIFNATAAREMAKRARDINGSYLRNETTEVLNIIEGAAFLGKTSTDVSYTDEIIIVRLNALGFKTNVNYDQRDGNYTNVSWE